jgi:hypothetical protein
LAHARFLVTSSGTNKTNHDWNDQSRYADQNRNIECSGSVLVG